MVHKKRGQINDPLGQPVRFYKFVALSFLVLTIILLALIVFMSSKRATITVTTKPEPVETHFSVSLGRLEEVKASPVSGFVTSTVVTDEQTAKPKGVREENGIASGRVTLYNDGSADQPLVATTRLLNKDQVLFRLKQRVLVPAASSIEAEVYADQSGPSGDIPPGDFIIPGLNQTLQKVIYAKSLESMSGGIKQVGIVSKEDIDSASVLVEEELKKKAETLFKEKFPDKKVLVSLIQKLVESDVEVGTETDSFTLKGRATALGVLYDEAELKSQALTMLGKQIVDSNEMIQSSDLEPSAALGDYNVEKWEATLEVSFSALATLDPNSKDLQKIMFFGKTEDEVRRYLLSLDHVQSVDTNFRPLWNRTVPHVGDHVQIVLRQVE
ncbi:MAG: hypothetical protein HYY51_02135 [Candidatus Magasanikbacteria bacterium]|nr:hypothetical protein [Candidatus Magasanikbacteria bacterium]